MATDMTYTNATPSTDTHPAADNRHDAEITALDAKSRRSKAPTRSTRPKPTPATYNSRAGMTAFSI